MKTRVLLVDDSPDDAEQLISLVLQDHPEFIFEVAADGDQAFKTLADQSFDCILLDYRLGKDDGLELLPKFLELNGGCPVIMLTGQGSETVAAASIIAGASDYMVKRDATGTDLRTAINRAVERAEMQTKLARQEQELLRQGRLEALGQLSAGIAHDFNNLLATIRFGVDGVRRAPSSPKSVDRLDMVLTTIDRAAERAQSLLAFASQQPGRISTIMCSDVFAEIRSLAMDSISSSCKIDFVVPSEDHPICCDHGLLQNALLNLIINARDAVLAKDVEGCIEVSSRVIVEENNNFVEFCVLDNGIGIPEEDIDRVVDPYFSTKQETGGSGLGLSMVHGFVRQNGGSLQISSTEDGTDIRFTVPMGSMSDVVQRKGLNQNKAASAEELKILVVEDEALLARMMKFELEDAGFDVSISCTAAEAMDQLERGETFDALVTDISLGGRLNGFDVAKKAKTLQPNIKIVGISGFYQFDNQPEPDVIDAMLAKPFQPTKLISILSGQEQQALS